MAVLTVLCGVPGSGKSTLARTLGGVILTLDNARPSAAPLIPILARRAADLLGRGADVVVDTCATRWDVRSEWLRVARGCGATARLVLVACPIDVAQERVSNRSGRRDIPPAVMWRYAAEWHDASASADVEGWDQVERRATHGAAWPAAEADRAETAHRPHADD